MKHYVIFLAAFLMLFTACTPEEIQKWTVTVQSADNVMGYTSGSGVYEHNATATIKANPNNGFTFTMWSDSNTANPREVIVTGDITYTAYFSVDSTGGNGPYTVTVKADSIWIGNNRYPMGIVSGSGTYEYGSTATISATGSIIGLPSQTHFSHWSDGSTDPTRGILVTENCEYTAYFEFNDVPTTVSENILVGKWQKRNTHEYYRFNSDHSGEMWDVAQDVQESEGTPINWILSEHTLSITFHSSMGESTVYTYDILLCSDNGSETIIWIIDAEGFSFFLDKIEGSV